MEARGTARTSLPLIPDPEVDVSDEFTDRPGFVEFAGDANLLTEYAVDLSERWRIPAYEPYVFYATDFGSGRRELRNLITESVEATTGLACRTGEYVQGSPVQSEILRMVMNASVLIADVSGDSPNVYVEIGAARAAGVPVALLRKGDPGRPAFMLRDHQVYDYETDAEALGRAIRVSYPYRRFLE